jgi:hypothetical protein
MKKQKDISVCSHLNRDRGLALKLFFRAIWDWDRGQKDCICLWSQMPLKIIINSKVAMTSGTAVPVPNAYGAIAYGTSLGT